MSDFYDLDGDGAYDTSTIDRNGDGAYDAFALDTSDNGVIDAYAFDTDYDGDIDVTATDYNENGVVDAAEHQTVVYGNPDSGGAVTLTPNPAGGIDIGMHADRSYGYVAPGFDSAPVDTGSHNYDSYARDSDGDGTFDARDDRPANPYAS